jgi:hypothetical protein
MVASARLRLLYSLLYSEHINHFQVLGFLPFPYSSHVPIAIFISKQQKCYVFLFISYVFSSAKLENKREEQVLPRSRGGAGKQCIQMSKCKNNKIKKRNGQLN